MTEKNVKIKSYDFALKVVNMYQGLSKEQQDFFLSKQLLIRGTSIGAKLEGVMEKDSKKDVFIKLNLSRKEIKETNYLLRLLKDIGYLPEERYTTLRNDCDEIFTTLEYMIGKLKRFTI